MNQTFGRIAAALGADRSREAAGSLALAVAVLAAWAAWLIFARVPLYEVSAPTASGVVWPGSRSSTRTTS